MRRSRNRQPQAAFSLLLWLVAGGAAAVTSAADVPGQPLIDTNYRFRLDPPGPGWQLLGEAEVQRLLPDALAGSMSAQGFFGVLIVEPAPGAELRSYCQLMVDNMPLEKKQVGEFEPLDFQKQPALRFQVTGKMSGLDFRFQNIVFLNQGHAYQLVTWGLATKTDSAGVAFRPFFDAFTLLPGEVSERTTSLSVPDADGVGWRVRQGVFESVVHRLRVAPKGSWRVAVGTELQKMNRGATVGLVANNPGVYAILLIERAVGVTQKAFVEKLSADMRKNLEAELRPDSWKASVDNRELVFRRYLRPGSPALEYLHASVFVGPFCVQVLAWYMAGHREQAEALLPEGLAAIRFLDAPATARLSRDFDLGPDPQNQVGPRYSLRRGFYRDFGQGFTWRKPRGAWQIIVGDDARAENSDATLYLEEAGAGIFGLVVAEPGLGVDPEVYHRVVVDGTRSGSDNGSNAAQTVRLGKVKGRRTALITDKNDLKFHYEIVTAVANERAYQILFWGFPANMKDAKAQVAEAIAGFDLAPPGLIDKVVEKGRLQDFRFGFEFRPARADLVFADSTPKEIQPIGTIYTWTGAGQLILVLALCALGPGQDEKWFLDFMERICRDRVQSVSLGQATRSESTLGGLPGHRLSWQGNTEMDAFFAMRDRSFYALMVVGESGGSTSAADALKAGFGFID